MQYQPHPHQIKATSAIISKPRLNVWLPPGTGKTAATLEAISLLKLENPGLKVLVLAPLRVAELVWRQEACKFSNFQKLKISVCTGSKKKKSEVCNADFDVLVSNYENIPFIIERFGAAWPFTMLVADESTRLKSFRTTQGGKRAQMLKDVAHKTARWVNMTGTPSPNGLLDLWGQNWFIDAGARLGKSYYKFEAVFFHPESRYEFAKMIPNKGAATEILDALSDITFTERNPLSVDAPIKTALPVIMPDATRNQYDRMEADFIAASLIEYAEGPDIVNTVASTAAIKGNKCLQLAAGFIYTKPDENRPDYRIAVRHDIAKIEALKARIEEVNENVIVCYNFVEDLVVLLKEVPGAVAFDGGKTLQNWNAGRIPVLLMHPASAGHGLSLQDGGRRIIFYTHSWSSEYHDQVIERIGPARQKQSGYNRDVFVDYLVTEDTLERVVVAKHRKIGELNKLMLEYIQEKGVK
jgi:SNF2 family DNA or RNA helicase